MTRPPNVLIVMADQLAPQFTGAYGHPLVSTPHMEALAARGARFDAAYCNAPLCAPSRFSFMSGQLVTRIAAYDNAAEFPASIPTFAHYLRMKGYRTCLSGKMHFVGPDQLHGFDERLTTDIYPSDHAWTPDWEAPDERIDHFYHNMDPVRTAGVAGTTFQIEYDEETAFLARRRLFEFAMERTAPWCMVASFIHPHDPYVARPEWWALYDHDRIDMPRHEDATDPHSERLKRGIEADLHPPTPEQVRNARHAYYANTSYFDSKVGALVQALTESDQLDDTVVIVTADHGDMLGERGLWYKMTFFEHAARVPLIMAGPGIAPRTVAEPCSLVDVAPTLLEVAGGGIEPAMPLDGRSLWPAATGGASAQDEAIGEYCAEIAPGWPLLMIRRGRWKYIHCDVDPPQLYDLQADPDELTNLAGDPAHAEVAARFADEVAARWDSAAIQRDVIATQRRRRAVHAGMVAGITPSWDYQPVRDASREFVRTNVSWDDVVHRMQYPPPAGSPPAGSPSDEG